MIKVFVLNSNGKIEITEEELKKLLDDSYWEGYYSNYKSYIYTNPSVQNPITNPSITWSSSSVINSNPDTCGIPCGVDELSGCNIKDK